MRGELRPFDPEQSRCLRVRHDSRTERAENLSGESVFGELVHDDPRDAKTLGSQATNLRVV